MNVLSDTNNGGNGIMTVYGYARISRKQQSIERQIRNIKTEYPQAIIFQEAFTGRKMQGRIEFNKLINNVKPGDTIVFDSVSRMSRNAEEGFQLYKRLFDNGVELIFLKESYINTSTYKAAVSNNIKLTGSPVDVILNAINEYLMDLAQEQIRIAFEQAEKEVEDLRQRTREGIITARLNGKQIGNIEGRKMTTKKSIEVKDKILKYSKDFNGTLTDVDVIKLIRVARNTYYKYKRELLLDLNTDENQ